MEKKNANESIPSIESILKAAMTRPINEFKSALEYCLNFFIKEEIKRNHFGLKITVTDENLTDCGKYGIGVANDSDDIGWRDWRVFLENSAIAYVSDIAKRINEKHIEVKIEKDLEVQADFSETKSFTELELAKGIKYIER